MNRTKTCVRSEGIRRIELTESEIDKIVEAAAIHKVSVVSEPKAEHGSTTGLDYEVAYEFGYDDPLVSNVYDRTMFHLSQVLGVELCHHPDPRQRVNVNFVRPGKGYERHVDSCTVTLVVFATTHESRSADWSNAGSLKIWEEDNGKPQVPYRFRPKRGRFVAGSLWHRPHEVEPSADERITLVMAFGVVGDDPVETSATANYLYGGEDGEAEQEGGTEGADDSAGADQADEA